MNFDSEYKFSFLRNQQILPTRQAFSFSPFMYVLHGITARQVVVVVVVLVVLIIIK